MADHACQQRAQRHGGVASTRGSRSATGRRLLHKVYREALGDYFLAVIGRRRVRQASQRYRRAVLAGQFALALLLVGTGLLALRPCVASEPLERAAVRQWLESHAGEVEIMRWHAAELEASGNGVAMRVEYRYLNSRGKPIRTDRRFVVRGEQVVDVESTW
jgi:hypothetical protein